MTYNYGWSSDRLKRIAISTVSASAVASSFTAVADPSVIHTDYGQDAGTASAGSSMALSMRSCLHSTYLVVLAHSVTFFAGKRYGGRRGRVINLASTSRLLDEFGTGATRHSAAVCDATISNNDSVDNTEQPARTFAAQLGLKVNR